MNFFTILLSNDENKTIEKLINHKDNVVEIYHLNQLEDKINIGDVVFICIGGDAGKSTSWWLKNNDSNKGLKFIATITNKYPKYDDKNYKIKVEIKYTFEEAIKREDFIYWPDTYNTDASVATKGKQTQAISILNEQKYIGLLRGALYFHNDLNLIYKDLFSEDILDKIKSPCKRLIEKIVSFTEEQEISINKFYNVSNNPKQTIYYGVPGSGKSHKIEEETKNIPDKNKIRVVFHPEYTNADFVGQIVPCLNNEIEYKFKAGPFSRILKSALKDPNNQYFLIIEEINRGNAAAIFGDLFQLLDRDTYGWSEYGVDNLDINAFIRSENNFYSDKDLPSSVEIANQTYTENTSIKLPPNLSILATMNTSDQNVFTLDNAFQRRWDMKLIENHLSKESPQYKALIGNTNLSWGDFREKINSIILQESKNSGLSSMEDKRLGPWFIKAENNKIETDAFADKVLKYLWDDAFKFSRFNVFEDSLDSFEKVRNSFIAGGKVFKNLEFNDNKTAPSISDDTETAEA